MMSLFGPVHADTKQWSAQPRSKTTLWLRSLADFEAVNRAYRSRFSQEPPARVAIQVADLLFGAAVEIDAVAVVPQR